MVWIHLAVDTDLMNTVLELPATYINKRRVILPFEGRMYSMEF